MVCQWRKAFSRQSRRNCGSFFFFEMSRMMSSFNPGGAESASTSVTNPYLYSCLTKPSIVSVAVLILIKSLLKSGARACRTPRTGSVDGNIVTCGLKASWQFQLGPAIIGAKIDIEDAATFIAMKMAMLVHVGTITHGGAVEVYFFD